MDVSEIAAGHRPETASGAPDPHREQGLPEVAIDAVSVAIDSLLDVDLTAPDTGATLDLLRAVEVQARRLYAMSVAVIAEMDHRGLAAPSGQLSTTSLVRQVINISRPDAAARVRLAAATSVGTGLSGAPIPARLPLLAAAVDAGSIGPRHADLAASVFTSFDASVPAQLWDSVEGFLVEQAAVTDPVTFENVCRRIVLAAKPDGPQDEKDAHDKQEFHIGARRPNGLTKVWGLLDDITVESLRAAFGAMCAPAAGRTTPTPPVTTDPTPTPTPTPEPVPEPTQTPDATQTPEPAPDASQTPEPAPDATQTPADRRSHGDIDDQGDADEGADAGDHGNCDDDGEGGRDDDNAGRDDDNAGRPPSTGESSDTNSGGQSGETRPAPADPDPAPTWRSGRVPYQWAPLGTLPGDYPDLKPRLFGDSNCPDRHPDRQQDPTGRPRAATLRAQALGIIMSKFLDAGHAPSQGGEKPHLLVTITEQSLRDRLGHGTLGYGTHISIQQVRMLACDSKVIAAVLGGRSELLEMGRSMRAFNAATARAILLRDRGCVFPGCDMPGQWSENHHIQPWEVGGPSDYSNGCLLCRRHHTLIHRSDWTIQMAPDGLPEIIPPATHDPHRKPLRNTLNHPPEFVWPQNR